MPQKLVLFGAFSFLAFAWVFGSEADEISLFELIILMAVPVAVITIQCAIVFSLARATWAQGMASNVVLAVLFAANSYYFALLTVEASLEAKLAYAVAGGGLFLAVLSVPIAYAPSFLFALTFTIISIGQYAYARISMDVETEFPIETLPIHSKRNVYLISMESLHSPKAFRELYATGDLPHVDFLKAKGFRVLDHAYSADSSTRRSYSWMMEFSRNIMRSSEDFLSVFMNDNSTFRSFRKSGYGIEFMYISNYFRLKSELVDHAFPPRGFYVCDNLPVDYLYVLCREPIVDLINYALYSGSRVIAYPDQIKHLQERVRVVSDDDKPWLTVNHIAFPNHTGNDHRYDSPETTIAFKELMRSRLPQIAKNYRETVGYIVDRDPNAVVVTFGDHGAWLTRGLQLEGLPEDTGGFTREQFIEDRYGIMLAVYPADFCKDRIFEGVSARSLVPSIIQCLNGNEKPTSEEQKLARTIYIGGLRQLDAVLGP